jgi:histidine triad (HIT) family protein
VEDIEQGVLNLDCLFCKIAAGEIAASILYRDEEIVVFRDIDPQAPAHLLAIPVMHLENLAAAAESQPQLLLALLRKCAELGRELGGPRGYRLVVNTGPDGGQTVGHLHFHLLAGRKLQWPPG